MVQEVLSKANYKGYRKILQYPKDKGVYDMLSTNSEYETLLIMDPKDVSALNPKVIMLGDLNKQTFIKLTWSINHRLNMEGLYFSC